MRFFYLLARRTSYGFAIVFFTVLGGWLGAFFGYYLGFSFLLSTDGTYTSLVLKWFPLAVLVPTFIHYVHFGLLSPIKIPALARSLRLINNNIKGDALRPNIGDDELVALYRSFSDLPTYNAAFAAFYALLVGLLTIGLVYYDIRFLSNITTVDVRLGIRIITVADIVVVVLYGLSTYLLTEILSNRERAVCYHEIRRRRIDLYPRVFLGLRVKFGFFVILMIVSMLTFAALIQKSIYFGSEDILEIALYFVIAVLAGFFLMLVNTNSILRILREMSRVTGEIAGGAASEFRLHSLDKESAEIEYAVLKMIQEIEENRKNLEHKVEQRTEELQNVLSDLKVKDDLIQKQLDMASVIQRSILPGHIDDWNELKFSVRYIAMEKIGGDFYDVYQLRDDKLGILVADVSGHGIPAALVTTMAKISFTNACMSFESPRRIFQEVNQNILDHVKTQDYLTGFFVAVDDEYHVTFANASHQKAILLRTEEGRVELLDTNGLFIGAIEDARETYEEKTVQLSYGDRIILYTDGIPEAVNAERQEYSNDRFEEIILKNRHLPLEDFTAYIIEDVQRFIGNAPVEDDITLLVVELARDEAVDVIKGARKLIDESKFYEAIDHLERGLSLYPDNRKLMYNLSKNYFRVNNYGKTVEFVGRYLEGDKRNKYAYYLGGAAYYKMMNYNGAIEFFEKALGIDPNFVNALFAAGMAYKRNRQNDDAVRSFEKVISIDPDNAYAAFELNELRKK